MPTLERIGYASFETLSAAGVAFEMPPTRQPWGGFMAMFKDSDGNIFYLDQPSES